MSGRLYGAKCYRCGCISHHGTEGLEAEPIPWLEPHGLECARCIRCQERALSRAIQEAGMFIFDPEVREATEMFMRGDLSHPITQSLRAECLAPVEVPSTCPTCRGRGTVPDLTRRGVVNPKIPCPDCGGSGVSTTPTNDGSK